jgi:hypothetical protein
LPIKAITDFLQFAAIWATPISYSTEEELASANPCRAVMLDEFMRECAFP